jgi:hypothetical protein
MILGSQAARLIVRSAFPNPGTDGTFPKLRLAHTIQNECAPAWRARAGIGEPALRTTGSPLDPPQPAVWERSIVTLTNSWPKL